MIPAGFRALPTPDGSAIILVSDPTNGVGTGPQWLGVGGAIACEADNSIIVWSVGYLPPPPPPGPAASGPKPAPATAAPVGPKQEFLWPEGVEDAAPFDLDSSIVFGTERG